MTIIITIMKMHLDIFVTKLHFNDDNLVTISWQLGNHRRSRELLVWLKLLPYNGVTL